MTIEKLEALERAATPLPLELTRYAHGGGRVFNVAMRELVADFFSEGDRDLFLPMRESFPSLLAVAKAAKGLRATDSKGDWCPMTEQAMEDRERFTAELDAALAQLEATP